MFHKLRNKIIVITMAITTLVLTLAGGSIMFFSTTIRPEPRPFWEQPVAGVGVGAGANVGASVPVLDTIDEQELKDFIKSDRKDGNVRLLGTLVGVGLGIEIAVFLIIYYLSGKIVEPVKDAYDKQKMFIANASHELKTPLAVIQANMEALEVDEDGEKWKGNIETEITHANKLVLDLLQLAKMDAGSEEKVKAEKFDLSAAVRERAEMFQPKFGGKIVLKAEGGAPEYLLPKRDVLQVLDILLDNATKYGEKKIVIFVEQNGFSVENDGATVAKEDLVKIFDRFYQTDKTKEGSGLGLAIAKALCEQNGWKINCESDKKLTKFVVRF